MMGDPAGHLPSRAATHPFDMTSSCAEGCSMNKHSHETDELKYCFNAFLPSFGDQMVFFFASVFAVILDV